MRESVRKRAVQLIQKSIKRQRSKGNKSRKIKIKMMRIMNREKMKKKLSTTGWSSIKLGGLKSISYFRS